MSVEVTKGHIRSTTVISRGHKRMAKVTRGQLRSQKVCLGPMGLAEVTECLRRLHGYG